MFKIYLIVVLVIIGAAVCFASMSCSVCGPECESACGTRRFRTCCFNYLRRKRNPDTLKFTAPNLQGYRSEGISRPKLPFSVLEDPELWSIMTNNYRSNVLEDMMENGMYE